MKSWRQNATDFCKIIEYLVTWQNATNEDVLKRARAETRKSCGDKMLPVYDPFSGGCSIPLEAQCLGLPAYGSDLDPVAVVIGKAMIDVPSRCKGRQPMPFGRQGRDALPLRQRSFRGCETLWSMDARMSVRTHRASVSASRPT